MAREDPQIIPPDLLIRAYRAGIFPMADSRDDPDVYWVEPRMRAILPLDGFHLSHSLARTLRRDTFRVTLNTAFDSVIDHCAAPRPDAPESWISARIRESYRALHRLGMAHSVETWLTDADGSERLVGGLYGVGFDRVFCGESMFSRVADASKVALAWLVAALRAGHAELLDCQFTTAHLVSLGAIEITQSDYLDRLAVAMRPWAEGEAGYSGGGASAGPSSSGISAGAGSVLPAGFAALLDAAAGSASSPGKCIAQSLTHTS